LILEANREFVQGPHAPTKDHLRIGVAADVVRLEILINTLTEDVVKFLLMLCKLNILVHGRDNESSIPLEPLVGYIKYRQSNQPKRLLGRW
jgi:hypothetical protein